MLRRSFAMRVCVGCFRGDGCRVRFHRLQWRRGHRYGRRFSLTLAVFALLTLCAVRHDRAQPGGAENWTSRAFLVLGPGRKSARYGSNRRLRALERLVCWCLQLHLRTKAAGKRFSCSPPTLCRQPFPPIGGARAAPRRRVTVTTVTAVTGRHDLRNVPRRRNATMVPPSCAL